MTLPLLEKKNVLFFVCCANIFTRGVSFCCCFFDDVSDTQMYYNNAFLHSENRGGFLKKSSKMRGLINTALTIVVILGTDVQFETWDISGAEVRS